MITVTYCMRRKAGLSQAQFLAHWVNVHVPIVMANVDVLNLASYVRTVPDIHVFSERVERPGRMLPPFDGVAQLTWACDEDMRLAFESEEAMAVQRLLAKDEALFMDATASCRWVSRQIRHV